MSNLILITLASILTGIQYRLGGIGKPWNTKYRDIGVPLIVSVVLSLMKPSNIGWVPYAIALFIHFGLLFGSLTTYFKFGQKDVRWWNWAICGLAFGLSALPLAWVTHLWLGYSLRAITLCLSVTLWSEWIGTDWLEEFGRGFLIAFTLLWIKILL